MCFWEDVSGTNRRDYCAWRLVDKNRGMDALRAMFPDALADGDNFVLFSTSGIHGTYLTIEEEQNEPGTGVTFMIVQPRLVITRYGVVYPQNEDDFVFLKALRTSSWNAMSRVGSHG